MAEVINLRLARKARARSDAAALAAQNRARHGQSRAERAAHTIENDRAARVLAPVPRQASRGSGISVSTP